MDPRFKNKGNSLGRLIEELGEAQAAAGKTIRYGWASYDPTVPIEKRESNEAWLEREAIDVIFAIRKLAKERAWDFQVMLDKAV